MDNLIRYSLGKIQFWLAFSAGLLGFGYLIVLGGYIWRGDINVQIVGLTIGLVVGLGWLVWQGLIRKERLLRTGLEWIFVLGLLVLLFSLALSPDPRQGVGRVAWLIGYVLFFYLFISLLANGLDRWGILIGLITVVGLVMAQALAETLFWYQNWFTSARSFTLPDSQYRFTGLLSSSNVLMALANLFVPALIYVQVKTKRFGVRILSGIWLIIFFLITPFSSSRGGWLGLLVSLAIGAIFWAWRSKLWQTIHKLSRTKLVLGSAVGLLVVAGSAWLGMRFIRFFAADSSHGSDPFGSSGRDVFWVAALKIWRASPLAGAGPGRFGFAYLGVHPGVVPEFWPVHAHNILFQSLAEFGLPGLFVLLALLAMLAICAWKRYRLASPADAPWVAVLLAGLAGFLVQCMFDEFSAWIALMVPVIFILAWIWTINENDLSYTQIESAWLAIPLAILLGVAGWSIWAYQPLAAWQPAVLSNDWQKAAESASASAQRDPSFHFYQVQAGLLWSWEWQFNKDPSGFEQSRVYLARAVKLENLPSWIWADLAVMDFADHDLISSITHIDRAISMSPKLPEYYLNRANFYEQSHQASNALADYRTALALSPEWANHPFWTTSELRRQALAGFKPPANNADLLSNRERSIGLLVSRLETLLDTWGGNIPTEQQIENDLYKQLDENRYYLDPSFNFFYDAMISNRSGIGIQLVPGFIQLTQNNNLFPMLDRMIELHHQQRDCTQANKLATLRQELIYGFSLGVPAPGKVCQ